MKYSKNSFLYYIPFGLIAILRIINSSTIINIPPILLHSLLFLSLGLFFVKIVLDNHNNKELLFIISILAISIYIYVVTNNMDFLIGTLAIAAIKNVDLKKVIMIDLIIKVTLLLLHSSIYFCNYCFDYGAIEHLIIHSTKGLSHALYFSNPNTVGALSLLIVFDLLLLKKKAKIVNLVIYFIFLLFVYFICKSRTPIYIYLLLVILQIINSKNISYYLSKYSYFIMALVSFGLIAYGNKSSSLLITIDKLFSNRIMYSIAAFNHYGLAILPSSLANGFIENFIIDNFFVRCFINYGIISILLGGIICLKVPKEKFILEKNIFIVTCIYLFFEAVLINVSFALPFLIMGSIVFYKKKELN